MRISRLVTRVLALSLSAFAMGPDAAQAQGMLPAPDFLVTTRSVHGFDESVSRIKQAIEGENLMVVQEVNPQQMLRMVGVQVGGMRQIFFFHPRYMKQILETNRNAGIEPPLKLLIMEAPNGQVMIRYEDPSHQFGPYEGLEAFSSEIAGIFDRVAGSVTE